MKKKIFLIIIIILQVITLIIIGNNKYGYHGDELYSYHFTSVLKYPMLADNKEGKYLNNWHNNEFYKNYFEVSQEERFKLVEINNNIKEDTHPPIFYLLLHISNSIFAPNKFTKWTGIGLNIIFFVLSIIILFFSSRRILNSTNWALLVTTLYGFSIGAIRTVIFLRMYMILTFATLAFFYIHLILYEKIEEENFSKRTKLIIYLALLITFVFGILTHYYFLIFAFLCCFYFFLYLLKNKKIRSLIEYCTTMLISLIATLIIWPYIIYDMFSGYRGKEAFSNFSSLNDIVKKLYLYLEQINECVFSKYINLFIVILLLILIVLLIVRKFKNKLPIFESNEIQNLIKTFHIMFFFIFYVLLISKIAPYITERYILNVLPFIYVIIVFFIKTTYEKLQISKPFYVITILALIICTFATYNQKMFKYQFQYQQNYVSIAKKYKNSKAILLTKDNFSFTSCLASIYLKEHKNTYVLDQNGIDLINEKIYNNKDSEIILYFDSELDEDYLDILRKKLKAPNIELLFGAKEDRVKTYLLKVND